MTAILAEYQIPGERYTHLVIKCIKRDYQKMVSFAEFESMNELDQAKYMAAMVLHRHTTESITHD